jgi:hypothetical protein
MESVLNNNQYIEMSTRYFVVFNPKRKSDRMLVPFINNHKSVWMLEKFADWIAATVVLCMSPLVFAIADRLLTF